MLFLNPSTVTLLGKALAGVSALSIDRTAPRLVTEQSDLGPHCVFADVPEQRVRITIARALTADEPAVAKPGDQGSLSFRSAGGADDAGVRSYAATVVVTGVEHELTRSGGARQTIELIAVSNSGSADPITESEVAA